jgi:hypothetical protein
MNMFNSIVQRFMDIWSIKKMCDMFSQLWLLYKTVWQAVI